MIAQDDTEKLRQARLDMLDVLDKKLAEMPEWRAFRAMDHALDALQGEPPKKRAKAKSKAESDRDDSRRPTYGNLAEDAIGGAGKPLTTSEIIEYIGKHKELPDDPDRAKANITSALSRDEGFRSVQWNGGPAWWFKKDPIPTAQK